MDIPEDEPKLPKKIVWVSEEEGISFWEDEDGTTYVQFEDCKGG